MKSPIGRQPLLRLLAINLGCGIAVAAIAVAGLLILDIQGLRHLIFADQSPVVALFVIFFSFVITFGSWVMGSAIMRIGSDARDPGKWEPVFGPDNAQMKNTKRVAVRP